MHGEVGEVGDGTPVLGGVEGDDGGVVDVAEEHVEEEGDERDLVLEGTPATDLAQDRVKIFQLLVRSHRLNPGAVLSVVCLIP